MATRRRRRSANLGSTWQTHRMHLHSAAGAASTWQLDRLLEQGNCVEALTEIYRFGIDVGLAAADRASMGKKVTDEDKKALETIVDKATEATDRFKFACVVGGAFSGMKRRKSRR